MRNVFHAELAEDLSLFDALCARAQGDGLTEEEAAAERGFSVANYTKSLQKKYRIQLSALRNRSAIEENEHEPN